MPSYRCKIAMGDNKTIEKIIQSNSQTTLKKLIQKDGGFLINAEKERSPYMPNASTCILL